MIIITGASDGLGAAIAKEATLLGEDIMNISRRLATYATIPPVEVATMILQTLGQPKTMEVTDIVIERKK